MSGNLGSVFPFKLCRAVSETNFSEYNGQQQQMLHVVTHEVINYASHDACMMRVYSTILEIVKINNVRSNRYSAVFNIFLGWFGL